MEEDNIIWKAPQYDLSRTPALDKTFTLNKDPDFSPNFARISKWCPDGSVFLSQCENRSFQLKYLNVSTATFPQPAPIVDFAWYPGAASSDPATFCFVASVRDCPVKLLDASDGRLRASYPIIDHRERFIAPQSLAFNLSAQRLYCGFEDAIEVFEVSTPGSNVRLHTTPSKSSKDGLKGIISAMTFCPSYESDLFAAGSLSATHANVALFSEAQGEVPLMFLDAGSSAGVMQLQFNPVQPHLLYASFRRDRRIFCWDIRYNADQPYKIFSPSPTPLPSGDENQVFKESTNQRHRFDIDVTGRYLSVGQEDGKVYVYNLYDEPSSDSSLPSIAADGDEEASASVVVPPALTFSAHDDSIGSVAFQPTSARLLSSSGSRNFELGSDSDSDSSEDEDDMSNREDLRIAHVRRNRIRRQPGVRDNSLKLWKFG